MLMELLQRTRKLAIEAVTILAEAIYFWFQVKRQEK